jgi:hypothetical protein
MSVSDLIKERMKRKSESTESKPAESKTETEESVETPDIGLEELSERVGPSGLKRLRIEQQYEGRRTISASVPAWIKAALDYVAVTEGKAGASSYGGFGGKSRFIAEALAEKLKAEFPEVYEKLNR